MNYTNNNVELPLGWSRIILKDYIDIAARIGWRGLKKAEYTSEGPLLLAVRDISENGTINYNVTDHLSEFRYAESPEIQLKNNDVLVSKDGTIGRIGFIEKLPNRTTVNSSILVVRPCSAIIPKFLFYYFRSPKFQEIVRKKITGSTVPHLFQHDIKKFQIDVPPLAEQERIIFRLEELFTRLDAGEASLQNIKSQLQPYRQAVLKHAFNGKLSQEWRKRHQNKFQVATKLEQFLQEKRLSWEKTQLEKMKTRGKIFKNDKWKSKYHYPPCVETNNLPIQPEGWIWTNFEQLAQDIPNAIKAGPFGSALKKSDYTEKGYKIYGQEQVIRDDPSYGDYYINEDHYQKLKSCRVKSGDILISLVGTIGKVLILPEEIEKGIINPRLVKLSLEERLVNQKFIKFYLESSSALSYFSLSSHGGTMKILNLTILKKLPIPLPPLKEQEMILENIERHFSIADEVEKTTEQVEFQLKSLRPSILKKAFEGRLVSQDPHDEPAKLLLERIKQQKNNLKKQNSRIKNRKNQRSLSGYVK